MVNRWYFLYTPPLITGSSRFCLNMVGLQNDDKKIPIEGMFSWSRRLPKKDGRQEPGLGHFQQLRSNRDETGDRTYMYKTLLFTVRPKGAFSGMYHRHDLPPIPVVVVE